VQPKRGKGAYASIVELDIIEDETDKLSKVEIWSGSPVPFASRSRIYLLYRVQETCNQTVMSGRLSISFIDFTAVLFESDRVCRVSIRLFLVRNWCVASDFRVFETSASRSTRCDRA